MIPKLQEQSELNFVSRTIPPIHDVSGLAGTERADEHPLMFLTVYTKGTPDRLAIRFQNQEDSPGAVFSIFFIRSTMVFS